MGIWDPTGVMSSSESSGMGRSLGVATGEIRINTSQVDQAGVSVRRVGKEMAEAFKPVTSAVRAFGKDIQTMRGEIVAVGLAAAGITAAGLKAAGSLQAARIQLTYMVGNARAATQMISSLREAANAAGIPFADMLKSARLLLPSLEGNTQQLDTYLKLARRVATLNQQEGVAGASFAINEALASGGTDLVSLSERFQISRFALRDALAETGGDFAKALDMVLTKMGITNEMADEMGRTFDAALRRAADAAAQLAGTAFEPLLNDFVIPLLEKGAEWLTQIQQTNPAILQWGAALIGVVAIGAPLLLFLGQVITSLQTIRALSIAGSLGRAGAFAGIVGLGVAGGIQALRATGRATGNEELSNTSLGGAWEVLKKIVLIVAQTLGGLAVQLKQIDILLNNAWGEILVTLGRVVEYLAQYVAILNPDLAAGLTNAGKGIVSRGQELQTGEAEFDRLSREMWASLEESLRNLANTLFPGLISDSSAAADEHLSRLLDNRGGVGGAPAGPSEDELAAFEQFQADRKQIEADANADRLAEERDYQESLTDLSEDYNDARQKVTEDAQDRILDLEKRTADQIADIRENAAEREADEAESYQERITELREDYFKSEEQRLADFQREEERAKRQHNLTLLQAAANLDAKAIWQENLKYKQQRSDAEEDFSVETSRRATQLQDRLQQEQASHEERIREARRADEKRIEDLREHLREERDEIRADAAEKLAELQLHHAQELADLRAHHEQKLAEINTQEAQARAQRQKAFEAEMIALGGHYGQLLAAQQVGQDALKSSFEAWWNAMQSIADTSSDADSDRPRGSYPSRQPSDQPGYALGGLVTRTGRAMLHGSPGAPERVLSPAMTEMINRMAGGHSDAALVSALAGGRSGGARGGSKIINVENFVTPVLPGMNPREVQQAAYDALSDLLSDIAGDD